MDTEARYIEQDISYSKEEYVDGELDVEREFIYALKETKILRRKNKELKDLLHKYEYKYHDCDEASIIFLKTKLEEAKKIEDTLISQRKENERNCEKLDPGVVSLRKDLNKANA